MKTINPQNGTIDPLFIEHNKASRYYFTEEKILIAHTDNKLRFENYHKQLIAPFVIFGDFDAIVKPAYTPSGKSTTAYQNHTACGYGYKALSQPLPTGNFRWADPKHFNDLKDYCSIDCDLK
ncbi:hypothetical protein MAR_021101 [Mya arenaria]|uniref:Uncharacterized protein n=1 Tax=Mya arenaria TaxID=6604 RepID=A0ABY7E9W8_MYAAR|nr:hypothetical protein MAR_021101 [Mya arenaria]